MVETDIRRAMAQSLRDQQRRVQRQTTAIARSANIDIGPFEKPRREPNPPQRNSVTK